MRINKAIVKEAIDNYAVLYVRYSSDMQSPESIDAQVRACTEYCKKKGYEVLAIYEDRAVSGKDSDRESFQKMIADSDKKMFKWVVVHKLDRFSRNRYDSAIYKKRLRENGVQVLSVLENLDDSPESRILESLLEGMNQYYSENLARETLKGLKERAHKGRATGAAPLGYDIDPETKQYLVNERAATAIRIIFEQYSSGISYSHIIEHLNSRGYVTRNGKPFSKTSLYGILRNQKYIGTLTYNMYSEKDMAGKRNPQLKPQEEWVVVENGLPSIVDKDTFDKVQAMLMKNHHTGGKHKAKEIFLLSGLLFCAECGAGVYGNSRHSGRDPERNGVKYVSYRCSNSKNCINKEIRREHIESYVLDELYRKLFSDTSIQKLSAMLNDYNIKKSAETNDDLVHAQTDLAEVMQEISRVIRLVAKDGIGIDTAKGELKRLEDRKNCLESFIEELTLNNTTAMISEDMIYDLICKSKEFIKEKNISECRGFIQSYIEKVFLSHDKVEVLFKIQIPNADNGNIMPLKSEAPKDIIQQSYNA